jgi:hypothetical protein
MQPWSYPDSYGDLLVALANCVCVNEIDTNEIARRRMKTLFLNCSMEDFVIHYAH